MSATAQPAPSDAVASAAAPGAAPPARRGVVRRALRFPRTRVGLAIVAVVVLIAAFGPLVAPHSPTEFVGAPSTAPSAAAPLGTDQLGRDVLSRFLNGGRSVIVLGLLATVIGVGAGALLGLATAYAKGRVDEALMRANDVLLCFPQVVLVLLLMGGFGSHLWLLVLTVALGHAPRTARVIRGAAQEVVERDFVLAAEAIGQRRRRIIAGELLPNVSSALLVELGLRFTFSIALVAGVSFLGLGLQPPSADWGLMINENRLAIAQQPYSVLLPVFAIALLTVGTNLVTDGIARAAIRADGDGGRA